MDSLEQALQTVLPHPCVHPSASGSLPKAVSDESSSCFRLRAVVVAASREVFILVFVASESAARRGEGVGVGGEVLEVKESAGVGSRVGGTAVHVRVQTVHVGASHLQVSWSVYVLSIYQRATQTSHNTQSEQIHRQTRGGKSCTLRLEPSWQWAGPS